MPTPNIDATQTLEERGTASLCADGGAGVRTDRGHRVDHSPSGSDRIITAAPAPAVPERLHGLDAIRGGALLLGVVLHAAMSFLPGPQIWVVADTVRSTTLSVAFFVIHVMRMAVFFVIAGFFARMTVERQGMTSFAADRLKRIGLPLVIGWPIVFTAIVVVASVASGGGPGLPPMPDLSVERFPLTHLWFLYVLLLLYAGALALRGLVARIDDGQRLRGAIDTLVRGLIGPWTALVLAIPVAAALYLHPYWPMWFGVPTPDSSLLPNRAALVTYGLGFGLGWLVHRQAPVLLPRWSRQWHYHLAIGIAAVVACLATAGVEPLLMPVPQGGRKIGFAAVYAVALWSLTFAVLGMGLRFLSGYSRWRRYLADASYWVYLAHLPLVMALQVIVAPWALPWPIKMALIVGVAMGLLLLSYHIAVRSTLIGATLNGRRYGRAVSSSLESGPTTVRTLLLALLLALPSTLSAQAPPAAVPLDALLARHVAAIGPIETIRTRRTTLRITGIAPFEIPVAIEAMRPNLIRKAVSIHDAVQVTGYDGTDAWRIDPFVPGGNRAMDLPAAELADLLEEADFDGPLINPAAKGHRVEYAGPVVVTVGERRVPAHSLRVTFAGGRTSVIYLDAQSYLEVLRVQTRPVMGRDTEMTVVSSDYREVDGIQVPHRIEISPRGVPVPVRIFVQRIETNVPMDRGRFGRPTGR